MAGSESSVAFFDLGDALGSTDLDASSGKLTSFHVHPFVEPLLQDLSQQSVRFGIIADVRGTTNLEVERLLANAGLLDYVDSGLLVVRDDVRDGADTSQIFRLAQSRAAAVDAAARAIYVSSDASQRAIAEKVGFRVCPHPLLLPEVLAGEQMRYARIALPVDSRTDWYGYLRGSAFVPLHISGQDGEHLFGITSDRVAAELSRDGLTTEVIGAANLPNHVDLYLLRDAPPLPSGLLVESAGLRSSEQGSFSSTAAEQLLALPPGRNVTEFQSADGRHGRAVKLIADPMLLDLALHATDLTTVVEAAGFAGPSTSLTSDERAHFSTITADAIMDGVKRYSGGEPASFGGSLIASRNVAHVDNALAVAQLAADLTAVGQGRLQVRLHQFTHGGRTLHNVEAELAGTSDEVVVVAAHLDSTAESSPQYDATSDPAPGADDDASGAAAVVAIAACFVRMTDGRPPQHTVRFVLFNAEEEGLVGSLAYAMTQRSLATKIAGVFHMDMIAYNMKPPAAWEIHAGYQRSAAVERKSVALAQVASTVARQVAPILDAPVVFTSDSPDGDPADSRSDHASFHAYGYPACVASEQFFGGAEPDVNPNYHSREDHFDSPGFDPDFAVAIARTLGAAAWVLTRSASF